MLKRKSNKKTSKASKVFMWVCRVIMLVAIVLWGLRLSVGYFCFNKTPSLPNWLFWVSYNKQLQVDDYVVVETKIQGKAHRLIKIIKGVGGDRIDIKNDRIFINGNYIGILFPTRNNGVKLNPISSKMIPYGMYFMWTPHTKSFDSRYKEVGLIPVDKIIGRGYAIY